MDNIVRIAGGLGNQMFQYMFALTLGESTKFDTSFYKHKKIFNGLEIEKIFKLKLVECSKQEKTKLVGNYIWLFGKRIRISTLEEKLFGKSFLFHKKSSHIVQIRDDKFHSYGVDNTGNKYFDGYWASEKFFEPVKNLCKSVFKFADFDDDMNKLTASRILNSNSISIHVRRGDFVKGKRCINDGYWFRAIEKINEATKEPLFFIFSDDIEYSKELFKKNTNFIYINNNFEENSFRDMQLMSYCKHNIIANSTFSWWGAYLNKNPKKIVICPSETPDFPGQTDGDYFCESWIKI